MGPLHSSSIAVHTGIRPGSRPWTARQFRVPLSQLSRSMQLTHQLGVSIESVEFAYSSAATGSTEQAVVKAAVETTAKAATKESPKATTQEAASQPKRRRGRRRR